MGRNEMDRIYENDAKDARNDARNIITYNIIPRRLSRSPSHTYLRVVFVYTNNLRHDRSPGRLSSIRADGKSRKNFLDRGSKGALLFS